MRTAAALRLWRHQVAHHRPQRGEVLAVDLAIERLAFRGLLHDVVHRHLPRSCLFRLIDSILTNPPRQCGPRASNQGSNGMKLHGYFRSSASYRVRIALNLKGLGAEHLAHHLRKGEQRDPAYLALNPQGLVPTLQDDGAVLTQSLAIIEWLEETHPRPPLLPKDPLRRAKVRAFALALACDVHPVQNLKVLARLRQLGVADDEVTEWAAWANREGLAACEA